MRGVTESLSAFVSVLAQFCTAQDLGVLSKTCRQDHQAMDGWYLICTALLSPSSQSATTLCHVLRHQRLPHTYAVAHLMAMKLTLALLNGSDRGTAISFGRDVGHANAHQCVEVLIRREAWNRTESYSIFTDISDELDAHANHFYRIQEPWDHKSLTAAECARRLIQLVVDWGEDTLNFVYFTRPEECEALVVEYWFGMGVAWILPLQSKNDLGDTGSGPLEHRITRTRIS